MSEDIDMTDYEDDSAAAAEQELERERWEAEALKRHRVLSAEFARTNSEFQESQRRFWKHVLGIDHI